MTDTKETRRLLWERMVAQCPFEIPLLRSKIELKLFDGPVGQTIKLYQLTAITEHAVRDRFKEWESRKGVWIEGPDQRADVRMLAASLESKVSIAQFFEFLLKLPIGVRLLIRDRNKNFSTIPGRKFVLDQLALSWAAIRFRARTADGKLVLSMPCCGYRSRPEKQHLNARDLSLCLCSGNVCAPSGCCGSHKKETSKTLFNYYPLSEQEGYPELD